MRVTYQPVRAVLGCVIGLLPSIAPLAYAGTAQIDLMPTMNVIDSTPPICELTVDQAIQFGDVPELRSEQLSASGSASLTCSYLEQAPTVYMEDHDGQGNFIMTHATDATTIKFKPGNVSLSNYANGSYTLNTQTQALTWNSQQLGTLNGYDADITVTMNSLDANEANDRSLGTYSASLIITVAY